MFPKMIENEHLKDTLISRFIGSPNVLIVAGQQWKNQRKVANPAFRLSVPVNMFGKLARDLFKVMDPWMKQWISLN